MNVPIPTPLPANAEAHLPYPLPALANGHLAASHTSYAWPSYMYQPPLAGSDGQPSEVTQAAASVNPRPDGVQEQPSGELPWGTHVRMGSPMKHRARWVGGENHLSTHPHTAAMEVPAFRHSSQHVTAHVGGWREGHLDRHSHVLGAPADVHSARVAPGVASKHAMPDAGETPHANLASPTTGVPYGLAESADSQGHNRQGPFRETCGEGSAVGHAACEMSDDKPSPIPHPAPEHARRPPHDHMEVHMAPPAVITKMDGHCPAAPAVEARGPGRDEPAHGAHVSGAEHGDALPSQSPTPHQGVSRAEDGVAAHHADMHHAESASRTFHEGLLGGGAVESRQLGGVAAADVLAGSCCAKRAPKKATKNMISETIKSRAFNTEQCFLSCIILRHCFRAALFACVFLRND
jgi:hypothetical protein